MTVQFRGITPVINSVDVKQTRTQNNADLAISSGQNATVFVTPTLSCAATTPAGSGNCLNVKA